MKTITEAGIRYVRPSRPEREEALARGFRPFRYRRVYLPTCQISAGKVWAPTAYEALRLLTIWNERDGKTWLYAPIDGEAVSD